MIPKKTYEVSRDEEAYVTAIGVHLAYEHRHYPADTYVDFTLTLPGLTEEQAPIEMELQSIQEVLDVLGRYFEDNNAPEYWTEEYLKNHQDKGLQLLQAKTEMEEAERETQRSADHVKYYGEKAEQARKRIATLQAEIESKHAD